MEQKDWVRVVDYSQYSCRSWQYLYFENRVVQYIRIVGTHNTVNKVSTFSKLGQISFNIGINFLLYIYFRYIYIYINN